VKWQRGSNSESLSLCFLQLRKPVVEKMRRDRINSSIEQLKLLLEKEFQRHQPNSKLEKADILEMAVSYLKQQSHLQMKSEYQVYFSL